LFAPFAIAIIHERTDLAYDHAHDPVPVGRTRTDREASPRCGSGTPASRRQTDTPSPGEQSHRETVDLDDKIGAIVYERVTGERRPHRSHVG